MPSQADLATEALPLAAPYDTAADFVLSRQIIVAWAGEAGDEEGDRRLGWSKTNLIAEFGGIDLMKRLVPRTFEWAVIQGCLEAARHRDAELRNKANDPDQLLTLFGLGFEVDEQLDERLHDHKASGQPPTAALPDIGRFVFRSWNPADFQQWVASHGAADFHVRPEGRLISALCQISQGFTVWSLTG
ncbi:MAG: BREX-6 system BrxE protein [Planctomycetes bacterium]|nr:BREX-6 system BrxE protein [Planctomycetota bacterium]